MTFSSTHYGYQRVPKCKYLLFYSYSQKKRYYQELQWAAVCGGRRNKTEGSRRKCFRFLMHESHSSRRWRRSMDGGPWMEVCSLTGGWTAGFPQPGEDFSMNSATLLQPWETCSTAGLLGEVEARGRSGGRWKPHSLASTLDKDHRCLEGISLKQFQNSNW